MAFTVPDFNKAVVVRDLEESDIPFILNYWFHSPAGFVEGMGVDLNKLGTEAQLQTMLTEKVSQNLAISAEAVQNLELGAALRTKASAPLFVQDTQINNHSARASKLNALVITYEGVAIGFHTINPLIEGDHGVFHAHIWDRDRRGHGVALSSYPQACGVFMERFNLKRILFKTPMQNRGAIRVKEKLGIRVVGEELVVRG